MINTGHIKKIMAVVVTVLLVCLFPLNVDAKEDNKTVKVGWYYSKGFQEGGVDDEYKSGYAYEYLQHIANYTGWEYEYVYGSWGELYDGLLNGDIDILCGMSYAKEREDLMYFPEYSMGKDSYFLYLDADDYKDVSDDYSQLSDKTIGVVEDSYMFDCLNEWLKDNKLECNYEYFNDLYEVEEAFNDGIIDGFVSINNNVSVKEGGMSFNKIGSSDYYIAVSHKREDLLSELNNTLKIIFNDYPYFNESLEFKYFQNHIVNATLTDEELSWLNEHQRIMVGFIEDYLPFSGYDSGGNITGVVTDVFNEWKKHLEVDMDIMIEYKGYGTYREMVDGLHNGEIDVAFPIADSIFMSENEGIIQTNNLLDSSVSVIYKGDYDEHTMDVIAISDHSAFQKMITVTEYPDSEILVVDSALECLEAVQSGRATSTIFNSGRAERYLMKAQYANLKMITLGENVSYCMAVKKGNTVVYSLLERGIFMLDKAPLTSAMYKYTNVAIDYSLMDFVHDNLAVIIILLVTVIISMIVIAFFYVKSSKKEMAILNKERSHLSIMNILIKDFTNVFLLHGNTNKATSLKLEGYVTDEIMKSNAEFDYEAISAKYIADRVYDEDKEMMTKVMRMDNIVAHTRNNAEYTGTYRVLVNSEIHYYQYRYQHTGYEDEIIAGFQNIDSIIKEREEHNLQLEKALKEAEEANNAKSNFLFSMSHDIRTPMNAIIGFTELLEKTDADEKRQDYIAKIKVSSRYLLSLINNILEMARIESGKVTLKEELFDMSTIGNNVYLVLEQDIRKKHLNFTRKIDIQNNYVYIDVTKLREILLNLLSNAVKYTNEGGNIRLFVNETQCHKDGYATYKIEVSDDGIGMSEEFLPTIFDEFSREKTSTESKIEGTGLGMAIVKNLVNLFKGKIEVFSKVNEGTTFIVTLDVKKADVNNLDELLKNGFDDGSLDYKKVRILLVEDNELNREIALTILEDYGFTVECAENGKEALDKVIENEDSYYDLILMDIQMPVMNGYEAASAIRNLDNHMKADIPIVAMTANAFDEDKQNAYKAGMNGHIAKPIEVPKLIKEIVKALIKRG